MEYKRGVWKRIVCCFFCFILIISELPVPVQAAVSAVKFIKAEPQVFVPALGETATIRWNLENPQVVNVMIMDGEKVIAYLAKEEEVSGGYVPHEVTWDGTDSDGQLVEGGTYQVVVEPQGHYQKYRSVAEISVVTDPETKIGMLPNLEGDSFILYGASGKKQGVTDVALTIKKDTQETVQKATVGESIWYQKIPMSAYKQYEITAAITSNAGTAIESMTALRHVFRVNDRLEFLGSFYYEDYKKDAAIQKQNRLKPGIFNRGFLVGKSLLIQNPTRRLQQEISENEAVVNQHLGIIDSLAGTAAEGPASLIMGNEFYAEEDLSIAGFAPLTMVRMYNSMSGNFHEFGLNWMHTFTALLHDMGDTVSIQFEDGHIEFYHRNEDGTYEVPSGLARALRKEEDGTYTLTVEGTREYWFTTSGRVKTITDRNGAKLTFSYYDGMLMRVESVSGYLTFTYSKDGLLQSIQDSANRTVQYTYQNGLLTKVTNVAGNQTTYQYDEKNRLCQILSPEQVVLLRVTYDDQNRVLEKTVRGSRYQYRYNDKERTITCTDPAGATTWC